MLVDTEDEMLQIMSQFEIVHTWKRWPNEEIEYHCPHTSVGTGRSGTKEAVGRLKG